MTSIKDFIQNNRNSFDTFKPKFKIGLFAFVLMANLTNEYSNIYDY